MTFRTLFKSLLIAVLIASTAAPAEAGKRRADQMQADESFISVEQGSTPGNPASGQWKLYFKTDGLLYRLNSAGTESAVDTGDTLPVPDTRSIVEDATDATKQVRIEAGGITTGTTRVLTMADEDIDLGANQTKLDGIASGAEVNPDVVSQAEAEAGTATTERIWTAQRVSQAISALGSGSAVFTCETVQATTSGTAFDFTGLPGGIVELKVLLHQVGLDANNKIIIQLGDSGGLETTGYAGMVTDASSGRKAYDGAGIEAIRTGGVSEDYTGIISIVNITGDDWVASGLVHNEGNSGTDTRTTGSKTLSGTLTQLRITRDASASYNGGQVNVCHQ